MQIGNVKLRGVRNTRAEPKVILYIACMYAVYEMATQRCKVLLEQILRRSWSSEEVSRMNPSLASLQHYSGIQLVFTFLSLSLLLPCNCNASLIPSVIASPPPSVRHRRRDGGRDGGRDGRTRQGRTDGRTDGRTESDSVKVSLLKCHAQKQGLVGLRAGKKSYLHFNIYEISCCI